MLIATSIIALGSSVLLPASPAAAADVSLWRIDCGSIRVNKLERFSDSFDYAGESRKLMNSCFLIEHDESLLLWDTGFPTKNLTQALPEQLAAIGFKPKDIDLVGISHYHFEHIGQASNFADATLLIDAADLAALTSTVPL